MGYVTNWMINCLSNWALNWFTVLRYAGTSFKRHIGHWDWIGGFFLMTPLYFLVLVAMATCMCECLSPLTKSICATVYFAEIVFMFKFYKAQSFDVYKIGSKYFKAQGWGFTPVPR